MNRTKLGGYALRAAKLRHDILFDDEDMPKYDGEATNWLLMAMASLSLAESQLKMAELAYREDCNE